ncbi:hypothetical protein [Clostridium tagluense]|uniref:hypothetical protein n=1 Tax=Clostridium tagluense TaxID=360422 RepID=UPI001CF1FD89|nr:hypothetical protein [Clostridium tagluense]MCB2300663.1 hypothetical protein [Clostridium tagluense]
MALSKNITKNIFGKEVLLENTYCKIEYLGGNKNSISFQVNCYNNNIETIFIEQNLHVFNPILESNDNFIQQAYKYLKTLDDYKDAIDC